ncbi:hypothetical protein I3843_16G116500 [Carya illinoinensis]|uniref:Uncharacterized protein n=1 Tax=Carya illinoinensis TaxID=32201 RepID=A0A922D1G1_CARIL|nr:hypothetical protein I3842_16G118600 [Carya illinoinensis]KAG7942680.1 hypothetical protein I3843_16G116500 [Carya illinoinensis]
MASKDAAPHSRTSTRTCLCAPTSHPGSFRCSLHRNSHPHKAALITRRKVRISPTRHWEAALIAKANSLRAFLLHRIIRPSSHDLQRRRNFQPKPSRFCVMNKTCSDHHCIFTAPVS